MDFWILFALNILAYYLIGKKESIGFGIGFIGCILGIVLFKNNLPMVVMYSSFGILNVKNYLEWKIVKI